MVSFSHEETHAVGVANVEHEIGSGMLLEKQLHGFKTDDF